MKKIEGILVPLITNFDTNEELDTAAITHNIEKLNSTSIAGFFVLGSNGEAAHLSDKEQLTALKAARKAADGSKLFIAGISRQSAHATVEFGRQAQECGLDYLSVLTPSYFAPAMKDRHLISYYTKVADALDAPVLMYNCPKFAAGVTISVDVVKELAQHPNILGMKDTSGLPIEDYLQYQTDSFSILSGSINNIITALKNGSKGGVLSMANFLPEEVQKIYELFVAGEEEAAVHKAEMLISLNKKISGTAGVAGVKYACDLLGYVGGVVRSPLLKLDDNTAAEIKNALKNAGYVD